MTLDNQLRWTGPPLTATHPGPASAGPGCGPGPGTAPPCPPIAPHWPRPTRSSSPARPAGGPGRAADRPRRRRLGTGQQHRPLRPPGTTTTGNPEDLSRMFHNLLDNAVRYARTAC